MLEAKAKAEVIARVERALKATKELAAILREAIEAGDKVTIGFLSDDQLLPSIQIKAENSLPYTDEISDSELDEWNSFTTEVENAVPEFNNEELYAELFPDEYNTDAE